VFTRNGFGVDADDQVVFALYNGSQFITPPQEPVDVVLPDGMRVTYGFQQHGVVVIGASNNYIGLPGQGNLISGNIQTGVYITQRDEKLRLYATPTNNIVQANSIVLDGIYGVFRYDAPYGNPVLEAPAANANAFTGTPIPIGDYVTGFNQQTPGSQQAKSLLIYGPPAVADQAASTGAGAARRPGALRRKTTPGGKIPGRARAPVATAGPASPHPRALQRAALAQRLAGRVQAPGPN
jgi:hypothetical protein